MSRIKHTAFELKHPAEFSAYRGARARCADLTNWNYGGRGIRFLFTSFEQFFAELGPRPKGKVHSRSKWSVDRKNNGGHYEPGNVRWATCSEQARNKRKARPAMSTDSRKTRRHERLVNHLRSIGLISTQSDGHRSESLPTH